MRESAMTDRNGFFGRVPMMQYSLANLVQWGDHLSVDHPGIDAQHEGIFKLVGETHDLWRGNADIVKLRAVVDKLDNVLASHFGYEERMLAENAYPRLAEHAAEHNMMLQELSSIRERMDGDSKALPEPGWVLLNFMLGVTIGHILSSDIDYCRHITENRAQGSASPATGNS
jgi:hemerythrin